MLLLLLVQLALLCLLQGPSMFQRQPPAKPANIYMTQQQATATVRLCQSTAYPRDVQLYHPNMSAFGCHRATKTHTKQHSTPAYMQPPNNTHPHMHTRLPTILPQLHNQLHIAPHPISSHAISSHIHTGRHPIHTPQTIPAPDPLSCAISCHCRAQT
jgi:hypothetical protein